MQSEDFKRRRNMLQGAGYTLTEAANLLGISRNTLYRKLEQQTLDEDFKKLVNNKLKVDLYEKKIFEKANQNIVNDKINNPTFSNEQISDNLSLNNLYEIVLYMGQLLKLPLDDLHSLLHKEHDKMKCQLILDVIQTKERIELLEQRIKDKDELIAELRKHHLSGSEPPSITHLKSAP